MMLVVMHWDGVRVSRALLGIAGPLSEWPYLGLDFRGLLI